jgi:hypothetical protein
MTIEGKRDALYPDYVSQVHHESALPSVPAEVTAEFAAWLSENGGLAGFSIGAMGHVVWLAAKRVVPTLPTCVCRRAP